MRCSTSRWNFNVVGAAALMLVVTATSSASDWPQWRGPDRNAVSSETGWSSTGKSAPVWKRAVGLGYSNVAIGDGRLFTMGFDAEKEQDSVFCLDPTTGKTIWSHEYPGKIMNDLHGGGTLTTPTIDGDRVYTLSREGRFCCFKAADGEVIWSRPLLDEFELKVPRWGFSASPLVLGDLVVLNVGRAIAFNKMTGETLWKTRDFGDAYSTPVDFTVDGRPRLAVFAGDGLAVLDPRTGREHGFHEWKSKYDINASSPVVIDDTLFISSGINRGCALLNVSTDGVTVAWESKVMSTKMTGCVLWNGHLYGFDDRTLKCIDLEGNEQWRVRGTGLGSLMIADGRLIVIDDQGDLIIAKATPDAFTEISRTNVLSGGVFWTMPILVDGLIYCRGSDGTLVCLDHRPTGTGSGTLADPAPTRGSGGQAPQD